MGKKILFVFAGTGGEASDEHSRFEEISDTDPVPYKEDVVRVYFSGCQYSQIGGRSTLMGLISPNLDTVGKNIKNCFNLNNYLSLNELQEKFGNAVIIEGAEGEDLIPVDSIDMTGFSRGAVTTFSVARHLDELNIPMSLLAVEPVPGHSKQNAKKNGSEFVKNCDLTGLQNLVQAEVMLGAYTKHPVLTMPFHGKFFRQMAPLFPSNCDTSIYTYPKFDHNEANRTLHQRMFNFIKRRNLSPFEDIPANNNDTVFFVPKVVQQKFLPGVDGRLQILPEIKEKLFALVAQKYPDLQTRLGTLSTKQLQALHALKQCYTSKEHLVNIVISDRTSQAEAIREFIIEFENINQYINKQFQRGNDLSPTNPVQIFRNNVYNLLRDFPENATPLQKRLFRENMLANLESIKPMIPYLEYGNLKNLMTPFIQENVLLHPDLLQYLDQQNDGELILDIKTIDNPKVLAKQLHFMSEASRKSAYDLFKGNLPNIVKNSEDLGNILRYIPAEKVESVLNKQGLKSLIGSMSDVNKLMDKLLTDQQKNAAFKALKGSIKEMEKTPEQLGELMQQISPAQGRSLLKSLSFTSEKFIHQFLRTLTTPQINQFLPALEKAWTPFKLLTNINHQMERMGLRTNLEAKVTSKEAKSCLDKICPSQTQIQAQQFNFKQQLQELRRDIDDTPQLSIARAC
ncbi:hypothetical protein BN59_00722 [Legionella massiliensis]|uniref:Uncharacterized protein n=2 Tax=Legionella massiliensis TaxID=1034943 RepID=A0A078KXL0_9GAMM|nr:hypothetical protein BN59_00722 [Legionella massiliensis]CEE12191.1 hypothetical protein BN1094_00722 [Legionella massiliensis]